MNNGILIFDPVPYFGGSKQVAKSVVKQLPPTCKVTVITADLSTWQHVTSNIHQLWIPKFLQGKTNGIKYYLKHLCFACSIVYFMLIDRRFKRLIGISGPTVDFALYLLNLVINVEIIQLVQGPIPKSKSAAYGLTKADKIFCLSSMEDSVYQTHGLINDRKNDIQSKIGCFINAIDQNEIVPRINSQELELFWCASLLPWKRLDVFLEAISILRNKYKMTHVCANICYIKPPSSEYRVELPDNTNNQIRFKEKPDNLPDIRARSAIFISTSEEEPFGLSILESLSAKLAVVIPEDGAYWDTQLTDNLNCLKFKPNNPNHLAKQLYVLINNPPMLRQIAANGYIHSLRYSSQACYSQITKALTQ
ncbi:glycosyltransferase family 4 protein [Thalassotalea sp. M1531]|uniref:Glycosyltransferase family 4 protein n=1 Tax=Thalassotalea algicola TaxID=2716224 RepID=A0A7Y0LCM2_9GAMM|nr:glycosyltransferase family 4 protein [Thalassotalea algicola]NMP32109.1 glycosyltransferase family 4 protein [Thalassotalea algicola]